MAMKLLRTRTRRKHRNAARLALVLFLAAGSFALTPEAQAPTSAAPQAENAASAGSPQEAKPEVKPAPPTPIALKKVELGDDDPWDPAWDTMIEEALPPELLLDKRARAVRPLCPHFRSMSLANRRAFWAYFFQALAGAEAGLKPTSDVKHTDPAVAVLDRVTHRTVRQEGLLQLTYMDSLRYGCDFDWERDKNLPEHDPDKTILQPRNNLLCGIKILDYQLVTKKKPLLTESSYWVTLRPKHPSFLIFLKQMANVPEACGSPLRKPASAAPPASEANAVNHGAETPAETAQPAEGAEESVASEAVR